MTSGPWVLLHAGASGLGAALFDFDGDGKLDVYLLQNGGRRKEEPTVQATSRRHLQGRQRGLRLDIAGHNMGVAIGDVNNDGFPDVLVTQHNGIRLFLNNGNGTFTDVTGKLGSTTPAGPPRLPSSITIGMDCSTGGGELRRL